MTMVPIPDNGIELRLAVAVELDELGDNETKKTNDVTYD